ncbi:hypothetical protein GY45DRAFT_197631 [Cubamyces sp. BRFM 1775]|nr:hypothetical protein GY45DRAFT_197631 [Cubamyces sp. BRFM 1775]
MSTMQYTPAQLATTAEHLMAAKMYSLASCVMLFYDIAITFGDEVEKIWKQRFTGATVLWFLNRYLSPLGYIVVIVSFQDPGWSKATCQRYVLYPEVLKVFTATAVGIIFILRLYSIYAKRTAILYGFGGLLAAELAVKIWAFTDGTMLELPPGFVGCILTGRSSPGDRIFYTWVAELVFDSVIFFATIYRTITLYRRTVIGEAQSLITVIMRDGVMYFTAIFASNLVTVLIFIFATPDLKVINASFSTLITSLMVSRLMLNLRTEVLRRRPVMRSFSSSGRLNRSGTIITTHHLYTMTTATTTTARDVVSGRKTLESSIIGNLGAPVLTFEHEGHDHGRDLDGVDEEPRDIFEDENPEGVDDIERGYPLMDLKATENVSPTDEQEIPTRPDKGPVPRSPLLPRLLGIRSPRSPGFGGQQDTDHTRSLPARLVVQVTEEEVVRVDEPPPLPPPPRPFGFSYRPRSPLSWRARPSSPSPPHARHSRPARPFSPSPSESEMPPSRPTSPSPELELDLEPDPPAPLNSQAALPPPAPRPPSRTGWSAYAARRSWTPPSSWRLGVNVNRD